MSATRFVAQCVVFASAMSVSVGQEQEPIAAAFAKATEAVRNEIAIKYKQFLAASPEAYRAISSEGSRLSFHRRFFAAAKDPKFSDVRDSVELLRSAAKADDWVARRLAVNVLARSFTKDSSDVTDDVPLSLIDASYLPPAIRTRYARQHVRHWLDAGAPSTGAASAVTFAGLFALSDDHAVIAELREMGARLLGGEKRARDMLNPKPIPFGPMTSNVAGSALLDLADHVEGRLSRPSDDSKRSLSDDAKSFWRLMREQGPAFRNVTSEWDFVCAFYFHTGTRFTPTFLIDVLNRPQMFGNDAPKALHATFYFIAAQKEISAIDDLKLLASDTTMVARNARQALASLARTDTTALRAFEGLVKPASVSDSRVSQEFLSVLARCGDEETKRHLLKWSHDVDFDDKFRKACLETRTQLDIELQQRQHESRSRP